jgi:RNA polymerase sigma factor (sigma-70 family)
MRDSEVVASIVAGDQVGLAEAYDRYAGPLFAYCRSMLREPADAADAVQDTFLIATTRLTDLRDPGRLRPWLYAVARNECHRRIRASRAMAAAIDETIEVPDDSPGVGDDAERAELRALLRAAIRGLNTGEREILALQLWQGVGVGDAAAALGVSRNHAHTLLSRARGQLAASVGVLLVGRSGRRDCPALDTMLTGWDGQLTVLLRKRVSRHIERCEVCSDRQRRELRPAMLLSLSPAAALTAAAEAARHAGVPAGLKTQLLAMAAGQDPSAVAHRVAVGQRAGSFWRHGFPKTLDPPKPMLSRASRGQLASAAAGTAAAAAATVIALAVTGGGQHAQLAGGGPGGTGAASATPSAVIPGGGPSASPSSGGGGGARPGAPGGAGGGTSGPGGTGPGATGQGQGGQGELAGASATDGAGTGTPTGTSTPTRPVTTTGPGTPTGSGGGSPPPAQPPAQGTLTVAPTSIVLTPLLGRTLTLTAVNGPVSWSISASSHLIGRLTITPSAGTLAAGQSARVTITTSLASLASQLTVNPGGQKVTVLIGLG